MITRREFLELMASMPFLVHTTKSQLSEDRAVGVSSDLKRERPNFLVVVLDALSARHMSLYDYRRNTTPNIVRFAENSTVYHSHYASGNFTSPGTASLLSGLYPWTHRSLNLFSPVVESRTQQNIFDQLRLAGYQTFACSHNLLVLSLLQQFSKGLSALDLRQDLCLVENPISDQLFSSDYGLAVQRERVFRGGDGGLLTYPSSLLWSSLDRAHWARIQKKLDARYRKQYPEGLPYLHECVFTLKDTFDQLASRLHAQAQPFFAYVHLSPPHDPYRPSREYWGLFHDDWVPEPKPSSAFTENRSERFLKSRRDAYDEFVAYADNEFGKFYERLKREGLLENTWVILTSDHGELFERGIWMHWTPVLYEPLLHIPLVISKPGQEGRSDISALTSAVDLVPTLLEAAGLSVADWCEGTLLPNSDPESSETNRAVFSMDAKASPKYGNTPFGTFSIRRGPYKFIRYFGYERLQDEGELYNVENDPEERENLYRAQNPIVNELQRQLSGKLRPSNMVDEAFALVSE